MAVCGSCLKVSKVLVTGCAYTGAPTTTLLGTNLELRVKFLYHLFYPPPYFFRCCLVDKISLALPLVIHFTMYRYVGIGMDEAS